MPYPVVGFELASHLGAKTAADFRAKLDAGELAKADVERVLAGIERDSDELDHWLPLISRLGGVAAPSRTRVTAVIAETKKLLEGLEAGAKH